MLLTRKLSLFLSRLKDMKGGVGEAKIFGWSQSCFVEF